MNNVKEFVNKHLTAIIAAVFALIVVIVLAVVFIGGNDKDKNPGKEPGTEISTEIGTETGSVEDNTEDVETPSTEIPSTEVVTPDTPSTEDTGASETPEPQKPAYTFTEFTKTMYAKSNVNVRSIPLADGEKIGSLSAGQEVKVTGQCNETGWYRIDLNGAIGYVNDSYLVGEKPPVEENPSTPSTPSTPSQPNTPSGGGENADTNIEEDNKTTTVNGYVVETGPGYEHDKALAEAGLYVPVWNAETSEYFMLIKRTDNKMQYTAQLREYIAERGGIGGAGGGNNSSISLNGEKLYQIYVFVEQQ